MSIRAKNNYLGRRCGTGEKNKIQRAQSVKVPRTCRQAGIYNKRTYKCIISSSTTLSGSNSVQISARRESVTAAAPLQYFHFHLRFPSFHILLLSPHFFSLWISSTASQRPAHCPSHFTLAVSLPLFHAITLHLPHSSPLCDSLLPHYVSPTCWQISLSPSPPPPLSLRWQ